MEGKESVHSESDLERELQNCCNTCIEWEKRSKKAEEKCVVLELEVLKKNDEFESLQGRFGALAGEKLAIEENLGLLKKKNDELEERITRIETSSKVGNEGAKGIGRVVDLTDEIDEEDKVFQLMIENEVLECEKKNAESQVELWKARFKESESRVLELEEKFLSRSKERNSPDKLKEGSELPELAMKEMNEASGLEDGLDIATRSTHIQVEHEMVESDKIVHAATGVISTCSPSAQGIGDPQASGTHLIDTPLVVTPYKQSTYVEGGKRGIRPGTELKYKGRVRKHLAFGEEGSPNKKMAPSTPGGFKPASVGVIDISDSDGEPDSVSNLESQGNRTVSFSTGSALAGTLHKNELSFNNNLKSTLSEQSDEEDMGDHKGRLPFVSTPRRKRGSNIVTSDSENSDDDNLPISEIKTKRLPESYTDSHLNDCSLNSTVSMDEIRGSGSRRRLVNLRKLEGQKGPEISFPGLSNLNTSATKDYPVIATSEEVEDDKMEEDGSDSEGESLGGFIVDSSSISDGDEASGESEDSIDDNMDYKDIISRIRRNQDHTEWEFEADMLAAFGKDPELCMKAVCALYRQQTIEEKSSKGTIYSNQRGFSQCDAYRGSALAEFLTDGDPKGDLMKNVEELREYNPKGIELCRTLATHYSKQLFAIYKNKEDPFFLPP
ncbi:hypothetical protein LguiB_003750 [Lonicera macranthoides]